MGFFLTLIFITAFLNNPSQKALLVFMLSLVSAASADLLFVRLRGVKPFFPSGSLVTGSIIGLLTSPDLSWYVPIVIGIIAMFSKNFIRFSNRHIFNPAGFGLLVGAIIFGYNISWWAVSFQKFSIFNFQFSIPFLILLSPALVSIFRMKRYRIVLSFLIAYALLNQFLNLKSSILNLITDPTILFFSLVMLPEPMTTPNNHKRQVIFGIFVALFSIFSSYPISNFKFQISNLSVDPLIFALLLGNLVFLRFR
jgi:Na+-translocating ferredoxin:NAD+ oxidoreductase RnfD subunit